MSGDDKNVRILTKILELVEKRGPEKTCCPSEIARILFSDWRPEMELCRRLAWDLEKEGRIEICQGGIPVKQPTKGPIRLKVKEKSTLMVVENKH